jgi:hypothetical protein
VARVLIEVLKDVGREAAKQPTCVATRTLDMFVRSICSKLEVVLEPHEIPEAIHDLQQFLTDLKAHHIGVVSANFDTPRLVESLMSKLSAQDHELQIPA